MGRLANVRERVTRTWIPDIYAKQVRSERSRSRMLEIPPRENPAEIQYTLLGIELKIGKRRFACPDLATARYLRIFARIGCVEFAIPYDITRISVIADELETAWQTMLLIFEEDAADLSMAARSTLRRNLLRMIRDEIAELGAGPLMPEFKRKNTARPG